MGNPGAYLGVTQWAAVAVIRGAGWWWWWKQQCTCGHVWSCIARFGEHAPSCNKNPLLLVAINAVVAQWFGALLFVPISLRSNLMCALFFFVIYYYYYNK
jgi:hypothetical protein